MLLPYDLFKLRPFHLDSKAVTLSKGDAGMDNSEKRVNSKLQFFFYKMLQTSLFVHFVL